MQIHNILNDHVGEYTIGQIVFLLFQSCVFQPIKFHGLKKETSAVLQIQNGFPKLNSEHM
jgi:hypothetical protein